MIKQTFLNEIIYTIHRLNNRLIERTDELVAPIDLTSARWQILEVIANSDQPLSAPQIAKQAGMTRQGAQKQINLILEEKYCDVLGNPNNLRSKLYVLNKNGKKIYGQAMMLSNAWLEELSEPFEARELEKALDTLLVLQECLDINENATENAKKEK